MFNLGGLTSLPPSAQSDRITAIEGLDKLTKLEQLYLSSNGISQIAGLEANTQLDTLDLASNRIAKIENVAHLTGLEEFWVGALGSGDLGSCVLGRCSQRLLTDARLPLTLVGLPALVEGCMCRIWGNGVIIAYYPITPNTNTNVDSI